MKKRIVVAVVLAILLAGSAYSQTKFGFRIVDSSGFSAEVGNPSWSEDTSFLKEGDEEVELSISTIAKANFDWMKDRVSVTTSEGETKVYTVAYSGVWGLQIKGFVRQAGISCTYSIAFTDVRSVSTISGAVPAGSESGSDAHEKYDCRITYPKGGSTLLEDVRFYYRGSFDTGVGWAYNGLPASGPGFQGKMLQGANALTLRLGKGSYDVPFSKVSSISFKNRSFLTVSGFRGSLAGALDLVVLAGQVPMGRVALYPQSIDEMSLSASGEEPEAPTARQDLKWSVSGFRAGSSAPSLALSNVRSDVYSPAINWDAAGSSLAFRAALQDYGESGTVNKDQTMMIWDKTFESRSIPVQVGPEYWVVPFSAIKDLAVGPHGSLTISLRDGSSLQGNAYQHWKGFVGDGPQGEIHVALLNMPPRLSFVEPGKVFAAGLGITGSIVESMQHFQGQRDYLAWAITLTIENSSSSAVNFGSDLLLMECEGQGRFDGAYVAYTAGSPQKKPGMTYFDSESQAYALANFEEWWSDGTMRGFRNGGPYVSGDPPDHQAEATICNSTLAPGASIKLEKQFTQGSSVNPHTRVLVVLPAISSGAGRARLVLSFVKPDSSRDEWLLDSAQVVRLTLDDLLATLRSAKDDFPLGVLALHWLTDLDPTAAAPFIDENIRDPRNRYPPPVGNIFLLRLVASIQLLANSHLQPGPEALSVINTLAGGGNGWVAFIAKQYLSAAK